MGETSAYKLHCLYVKNINAHASERTLKALSHIEFKQSLALSLVETIVESESPIRRSNDVENILIHFQRQHIERRKCRWRN